MTGQDAVAFNEINAFRVAHGFPASPASQAMVDLASAHAKEEAAVGAVWNISYSQSSPPPPFWVVSIDQRSVSTGLRAARYFEQDPGHCVFLFTDATEMGVAHSGKYWSVFLRNVGTTAIWPDDVTIQRVKQICGLP